MCDCSTEDSDLSDWSTLFPMPPPTAEQVQAAVQCATVDSESRSVAVRSLRAWQQAHPEIGVDEDAIRLYVGLKALVGRVTPNLMKGSRTHVVSTSMLKQKVWVVAKKSLSELPATIAPFAQDPALLSSLPPDCAAEAFWFLDQAVPRSSLPVGTLEYELAVGHKTASADVRRGPAINAIQDGDASGQCGQGNVLRACGAFFVGALDGGARPAFCFGALNRGLPFFLCLGWKLRLPFLACLASFFCALDG